MWLSVIQPWRYRESVTQIVDDNTSNFHAVAWEGFLARHVDFYNGLFQKLAAKFFRLDLSSGRNAYMLFRVAKVLSQDGLPEALKVTFSYNMSPVRRVPKANAYDQDLVEMALNQEFGNLFDAPFRRLMEALILRAVDARITVMERKLALAEEEAADRDEHPHKDPVTAVADFLSVLIFGKEKRANPEAEEMEKTAQNLEFSEQKLAGIFGVDLAGNEEVAARLAAAVAAAEGDEDSVVNKRRRRVLLGGRQLMLHDEDTVMTPQKRWEIVNRASRYSPKYQGNPDEAPLRSDEVHFMARLLYK